MFQVTDFIIMLMNLHSIEEVLILPIILIKYELMNVLDSRTIILRHSKRICHQFLNSVWSFQSGGHS